MTHTVSSRKTLSDVIEAIRASNLEPRRKQELISSIHTVARVIGRDPAAIDAHPLTLSVKLRHVAPIAIGLSRGRWNNVRSHLRAALEFVRPMLRGKSNVPMSLEWFVLYRLVASRSDKYKLSRPLRWMSSEGIRPQTVTRADLERYRVLLTEGTLIRNVDANLRLTLQVWNRAANKIPNWPQILFESAPNPRRFSFEWSYFPASLKADVDRLKARLSGSDLLDPDAPVRALREATLTKIEYDLRSFASALIHRGRRAVDLVSIAACLTIENYKEGLHFFLERRDNKATRRVSQVADGMKAVAKHYLKTDRATLTEMDQITRRLAVKQVGMTQKNRERLLATDDPEIREKLLSLPWTLQTEVVAKKHGQVHRRVLAQMSVIIALELVTPLRIKNLASLEIGRHVKEIGTKLFISIPADELKNRMNDVLFEMPDEVAELIRWYLENYRLADPTCPYLFPGTKGRAKAIRTIQTQVEVTVHTYTGLKWNMHLFRHLGAKVFLDEKPGEYEIVRRVLTHASMKTTTNAYTGLETVTAGRYFAEQILKRRNANKANAERRP